jgi:hypothetical protein
VPVLVVSVELVVWLFEPAEPALPLGVVLLLAGLLAGSLLIPPPPHDVSRSKAIT